MAHDRIVSGTQGENGISFGLSGKTVVVAGGAGGIGWAIAELMAELGANVALCDIVSETGSRAAELEKKVRVKFPESSTATQVLGVKMDVTDETSVKKGVEEVVAKFHRLDVLVHSAGVVRLDKAESLSSDAWRKTLSINLTSAFLLAQAAFPHLKKNGGSIINIASQAAEVAIEEHAAYCASKAGMVGLTKVLALEWGRYGITANCVSPTIVMTALGRKAWSGARAENALKNIPMGRFAEPHEVAEMVAYLASDLARMVTGTSMLIDGGWTVS